VNGPAQSKISVKPARSNKITANDNSDISLAVSRIFGEHPAPSEVPPKSYISQIEGLEVGKMTTGELTGVDRGTDTTGVTEDGGPGIGT
jgi:hypothetical protein